MGLQGTEEICTSKGLGRQNSKSVECSVTDSHKADSKQGGERSFELQDALSLPPASSTCPRKWGPFSEMRNSDSKCSES